jgi:glutamate-1-semialdehyde 2,1-aminomutase
VFTISVLYFGLLLQIKKHIRKAEDIDPASMEKFKKMHRELIKQGHLFRPIGLRGWLYIIGPYKIDLEKTKTAIFDSLDLYLNKLALQ